MYNKIRSVMLGLIMMVGAVQHCSASEMTASDYLKIAVNAISQARDLDQSHELDVALKVINSLGNKYLESASSSLDQAYKLAPRAETKDALSQIDNLKAIYQSEAIQAASEVSKYIHHIEAAPDHFASFTHQSRSSGSNKAQSRTMKEEPVSDLFISLLGPILAACVALTVLIESRKARSNPGKRVSHSSQVSRAQLDDMVRKLKYQVTDLSISDEDILALRNDARNLGMAT